MSSPNPPPDIYAQTLAVFEQTNSPHEPLTTTEVADALDCKRRTVYKRLTKLAERGDLQTKKVGSGGRVWWPSQTTTADAPTGAPTDRSQNGNKFQTERDHFDALVQAVEEYAIFMLDPDGNVRTWNSGAEHLKGYTADEIIGDHFERFYTDDDRAAGVPQENLDRASAQGVVEDEGWRVRNDGTTFWANVTITAIRDNHGALQGYAKVTRDMTERRERERQLRHERDLTDRLLDTAPIRLAVVQADGSVERLNSQTRHDLGIEESEQTGYSIYDLRLYDTNGESIPVADHPVKTVLETGEPIFDQVVQHDHPAQGRRWMSLNATPVFDDHGELVRIVVAGKDITELKQTERELARQRDNLEAELAEVFERIDDGFLALDDELRFTYMNDRAQDFFNISESQVLGRDIRDAIYISETAEEAFTEALETQEPVTFEDYYDPLDAWIENQVYPSDTGISLYFRDISEQKRREHQLEAQNERLDRFASMLAHELRNPVTIGQIYSQQLPDDADSDAADYIEESFERIEAMIEVMLVLTRGGDAVGDQTRVELTAVVQEAWNEVETTEATLEVQVNGVIWADETYIHHLFRNLFENAVEHGGPGVTVTVGELPTGFFVADTGNGIPAEKQDDVFKPGYTTGADQGGTGLGLAFVRELAEVYEWECAVAESAGGGARFEFTDVRLVSTEGEELERDDR